VVGQGSGIKQWKEEANEEMQEEGQLTNDKLKILAMEGKGKKMEWKTSLELFHNTGNRSLDNMPSYPECRAKPQITRR
jgi:hypothetical protein